MNVNRLIERLRYETRARETEIERLDRDIAFDRGYIAAIEDALTIIDEVAHDGSDPG